MSFSSLYNVKKYNVFLVQEPFNAEPLRCNLLGSYITTVDMFYKRNHGPIPLVDNIDRLDVENISVFTEIHDNQ